MAFAFRVSLVTGMLLECFRRGAAARSDSSGLWRAGRGISGGRGEHRLRAIFVIAETAISLVLLGGSGLLIGSFVETMRVPPGFDPHHILMFRLGMSSVEFPQEKVAALFSAIVSAARCDSRRRVGDQLLSGSVLYDISSRFALRGDHSIPMICPWPIACRSQRTISRLCTSRC